MPSVLKEKFHCKLEKNFLDMSSLKYGRDIALISHSQGIITDKELIFLLEENTSRNPEFSYDVYGYFDLEEMEEPKCKS